MIFPEAKLVKMRITPFKDSNFQTQTEEGALDVLINPESLKESFMISYKEDQPTGTSGNDQKFEHIKPGEFSIKLLLDGTGVFDEVDNSKLKESFKAQLQSLVPSEFKSVDDKLDKGISDEVEHLKTILFRMNGDTHQTNYIQFNWAAFEIKCKVKKIDIDYKLFNNQGYPIRVEVNLTCINTIHDILRKAEDKLNSPDLTHVRVVKEGDTLPLMTHKIYGDPKYYLEVARVNNLLNFRDLTPGQEIYFPPLDKTKSA